MHDLDRIQLEAGEHEYGELGSEQELEQFLGDLISGVAGAAGRFAESPTGHALGGILKDAARKALPVVGQAIGDYVAPGRGGDWGQRAGAAASRLFELELEGLSNEDKEFELARRYVQWARSAAHSAARANGRVQAPPATIARSAAVQAARRYAPGLLSVIDAAGYAPVTSLAGARAHSPLTGRWVRRGRYVVVHL
jgi:hypothetical protein